VVHGIGQWQPYNATLLRALPAELHPASELIFIQIGDSPRGWRGQGVIAALRRVDSGGRIPSINITLSGNQPSQAELDTLPDRRFGIDHLVASGDRFDARLQDIVAAVKDYGKPVMVRIGGEFNGWWNGYHPFEYPKAFRKIVGMFRKAGAENAAFVWCYEPAAPGDFDEKNPQGEWKWFPGDDVIDWYSIDWFNKEDFTGPLTGPRGETAHGKSRRFLDMAVAHGKPVTIAESAPCRYDLSDPSQAERAWTEWFVPYFRVIAERSEIKWIHLISYDWTRARYYRDTGWRNNDLTADPVLLKRLIEELSKPRYLHADDKALLRDWKRIADAAPKPPAEPSGPAQAAERRPGSTSPEKAALMSRFDNPKNFLPRSGAGGTEWDAQYRCFIQTDADATSKGLPTHAEAARAILADAAKSAVNLDRHLGWVLHIKHFSQAYRPESATNDLRRVYEDLVDLKLGGKPAERTAPTALVGVTVHRDVVYGASHPTIQRLDAYLVKADAPTAAVIEFHGGGWRRGAKSQFTYPGKLIDSILAAGISVISVDYRLAPDHPMPAQTQDAARAVQFVRTKAREWNIDPARIAALGGSAGAHLAAWVALHDDLARPGSADPIERQSSRLAAFVDLNGPMDLLRARPTELARTGLRGADFAAAFTGAFACTAEQYETDAEVRKRVRAASPLYLVTPDDPPALIVHQAANEMSAGRHPPIPDVVNDPHGAWHGVLLADAMQKVGIAVTCRVGPQVGKDPGADCEAIMDWLRQRLVATHVTEAKKGSEL
jgi:acetyl esterase/lipase